MSFYEWSDQLDVNVTEMNHEHKKLISYMNTLYNVNDSGGAKSDILAATQNLVDYTIEHFANEENYMESINFEGLKTHKIIHQQLIDQLSGHIEEFKNSSDQQISDKFFKFLSVWLTSHIKGIDTKYANSLR